MSNKELDYFLRPDTHIIPLDLQHLNACGAVRAPALGVLPKRVGQSNVSCGEAGLPGSMMRHSHTSLRMQHLYPNAAVPRLQLPSATHPPERFTEHDFQMLMHLALRMGS